MSKPLLILYATVTGNAETCAESIAETARQRGFEPRVWSVEGYDVNQLKSESSVLFSVSTYGEGDPPDMAVQFWEDLQKLPYDALRTMSYAIYALGDSTTRIFAASVKSSMRNFRPGVRSVSPNARITISISRRGWIAGAMRCLAR